MSWLEVLINGKAYLLSFPTLPIKHKKTGFPCFSGRPPLISLLSFASSSSSSSSSPLHSLVCFSNFCLKCSSIYFNIPLLFSERHNSNVFPSVYEPSPLLSISISLLFFCFPNFCCCCCSFVFLLFFNLLCAWLLYSTPSPYLNELIRSLSTYFKQQD